jgi:hypothetical protein
MLDPIHRLYKNLVNDIAFDEIEIGLNQNNIFSILNVETSELRHSNFLAWLLDPKGSHGLNDLFLKRVLREVFASNKFDEVNTVDVEGFRLDTVQVLREWKNIDILVYSDQFVLCIENKVFSKEHSNQLSRYQKIVQENFPNLLQTFVYLTPEGLPSDDMEETYAPLSYGFITDVIEKLLGLYGTKMNSQTLAYLSDYVKTVRRKIMKNDELTELAQQIYRNHRDIFDFVLENRPDPSNRVHEIISKQVEERGWRLGSQSRSYVRFLTAETEQLIYKNKTVKNGWKNGETFLFELKFYPTSNKLGFRVVIAPADANYDTSVLKNILSDVDGFKPSKGSSWLTYFRQSFSFNFDAIEEMSDAEIYEKTNAILYKTTKTVEKVESKLVEQRRMLLEAQSVLNK